MRARLRIAAAVIAVSSLAAVARPADKTRRLAILPFQNTNGGKPLDYLSFAIAETLITELGRIPDLTLVERTRLNDAQREIKLGQSGAVDQATAQKVGRLLGADDIVIGSFQKDGEKLRVFVRIVDVQTGQVKENTGADGRVDGLFDLQDR